MSAPIAIVLGLGLFASVALAQFVQQSELRRAQNEFRLSAEHAVASISDKIDKQIELIRTVSLHFGSSERVTRSEFQRFVSQTLARYPSIQAVGWAPRVETSERDAFERMVREEGFLADFGVNERSPERRPIPAAARAEYFPVLYLMPVPDNLAVYGYDQAADPLRGAAMELARDTGEMVLSERTELAHTRFLMVSARSGAMWREKSEELGLDGYITKPIDLKTFAGLIEAAMN